VITRRTRSAVMRSQMFSLFCSCSFVSNGIWQRMNRRLPPSSLFNASTACAVVPLPAKLSRMMESVSVAKLSKC
jgi:hypothetical protein